ncbi:hypothetical protein C0J50_12824, partial [Silurus asotus]
MKSLVYIFLLTLGCGMTGALTREYIFVNIPISWQDARSYCRKLYRDLATVTTTEEKNSLLQTVTGGGHWIGLRRTGTTWTWSDGEQYSFLNWYSGQPYYLIIGNDCGSLGTEHTTLWVNYNCQDQRKFLCYRFLILVNEKKTWEEAQEYCRSTYTGLASVTSKSSLRQLKLETMQTETESVWTGLSFVDGKWLWVSVEMLGDLVSMSSQCPAPHQNCGSLNTTTNTLNIHNCNDKLNFVCYWK